MTTVRNHYGIPSDVKQTGVMIGGVELEIEGVYDCPHLTETPKPVSGTMYGFEDCKWSVVKDGSLREGGVEFVSPPEDVESLILGFKGIHTKLKRWDKPYSERTSIHVHVNCLDLETAQTRQLLLWYALFEPVFFAMVAPNRANNIHCVPLSQTYLPQHYKKVLPSIVERWSKYTAFNLLPLRSQGTIEFRHMDGHNNPERFTEWLKTIENWWQFGQACPLTRETLTKSDAIVSAFDIIFKDAAVKDLRSSLFGMLEHSIIDVKLAMI